jgi:YHS domain-containing protein
MEVGLMRSLFSLNRSSRTLFAVAVVAFLGAPTFAPSAMAEEVPLPGCPLTGKPIDFNISFNTDDGPVYFCCKNCCKSFASDPAQHPEEVQAQREALAKRDRIQLCCPLTGSPINPEVSFDHNGQKIGFCCGDCCGKFAADPKLFADKVAAAFTYQTLCPVSGKPIDPTKSFQVENGPKVYFCCGNCCAAFAEEPAKFAEKVAALGYPIQLTAAKTEEVAAAEPAPAAPAPAPKDEPAQEEAPKEVPAKQEVAQVESAPFPKCPVMKWEDVEFTIFEPVAEGPIFFSSHAAHRAYQESPEKYASGVAKQRETLKGLSRIQTCCPVSGKPVDPNVTFDLGGEKVAFCCGNCCAAFGKEPEKFADKLATSFTYQTLCPVSGKPIDPSVSFAVAEGFNVYFCCGNCCAAFQKEPAKFADKLWEQGYTLPSSIGVADAPAAAPEKAPSKDAEPAAEVAQVTAKPTCPVSKGADINFAVSYTTEEGPVFFCCGNCCGKFAEDPAAFAEAAAEQRAALASLPKIQVSCPISGKPFNSEFTVDYEGEKVAFCCGDCCAEFSKDPAKYAGKLLGSYTFQTKCPVSGKPINPKAFVVVDKTPVYFCCQGCLAEFKKKPVKYLPELEAQGYKLKVDENTTLVQK